MTSREELLARDDRGRALARTEFVRPVVLEAGAGTGKTSALVARVLCWSLGTGWARAGVDPSAGRAAIAERVLSRVVAITFTELAAAEMEERVGRVLAVLSRWDGVDPEPVPGLPIAALGALGRDSDELRARARALSDAEDALSISTIHAFARRILSEHAISAGIPPGFQVDADGTCARAVADEVLAEALPRALGERGDADWESLLTREFGPTRLRVALLGLLASGESPELLAADPLAPERVRAAREQVHAWVQRMQALVGPAFAGAKHAARSTTPRGLDAIAALARDLPAAADEAAFFAALRTASVEDGIATIRRWAKDGPNVGESKVLGDRASELQPLAADGVKRLAHLAGVDPDVLRPAWRVLHDLWARARARLDAAGAFSFQDLLARAADLLGRDERVRREVRGSIDQLLIDEFQDTDPLQYEIAGAIGLPDGPAGDAPRPGLFLVGDPKQSIYAFRGADLGAYEAFLARVLAAGGERASLVRNFRSSQAVLDEVGRLLEPAMLPEPGLQPAFERLVEARGTNGASPAWISAAPRGPIEHWVSWNLSAERGPTLGDTKSDPAREIEARAIASDLASLAERGLGRELPWSQAAILMRTTTQQEVYLDALREAGVPCAVERDRHFYQSREIEDASSLVACVLAPVDALALAAALRSSVVGTPDAALEPLWSRGFPALCAQIDRPDAGALAQAEEAVAEVARELADDVELQSECGLERVPSWPAAARAFLRALGELRQSFASEPADIFVTRLRERLLLEETEAARWLGPHRVAKLEGFFRELVRALAESAGGPQAVLRELQARVDGERESAIVPGAGEVGNAVRLLSIHKAKGLEFAVVYLADLHHRDQPRSRVGFRLARVGGRLELDLFGHPSLGWGEVVEREEAVDAREDARLLYVATTRAKDRLVLSGSWPAADKGATQAPLLEIVRRSGAPDLGALAAAPRGGSAPVVAHAGALWRFAAEIEPARALARVEGGGVELDLQQVRADAERVRAARERASAREALPLSQSASGLDSEREQALAPAERGSLPRHIARAVGVAVHRALEHLDAAAPLAAETARLQGIAARSLESQLDAGDVPAATTAAAALLARFLGSPLGTELRALGPSVVGREVPVLLALTDDTPTATIGSIDLLYRDPAGGSLVVADFKTDAIAPGEARDRIAATYGLQLRAYAIAAATALGTPCRPELLLVDPCVRASVESTADERRR